jgi:hypothetical protein
MRSNALMAILSSPRVSATVSSDSFAGHVAEIAIALNCALDEASNADAERQLKKLVWLLCSRSGGGACRTEIVPAPECTRTHRCVCGQAAELVAAD